jgi:agmatine deiminase
MNNTTNPPDLPAANGYRMPAEWELHAATWLAWPHEESDWPGKFAVIPWVYVEIVKALARHERVNILVRQNGEFAAVNKLLDSAGADTANVALWSVETDRSWVRDSGPIFVVNNRGERGVLDWQFNAWAKYANWTRDDQIPQFVANLIEVPRWQPNCRDKRVVLEGGSIDVNGQGLMLTTEECLLSTTQQRNPTLDRGDYERVFADYLGVKKVLWLGRGIAGDDTHGHVDDLARFVDHGIIVTVEEENPADENYSTLQENRERLDSATDLAGNRLEVVTLPMPRPIIFDGVRLPSSYANFYIANGIVIVPTFNDPADRVALGTLAQLFPDREVVGIHCLDLVWGLGTLHCMTQQEPAAIISTQ